MKVTTPALVETPDALDTVSLAPRLEVRVTVFPEIGFDCASFNVMVNVAGFVPLAGKVPAFVTTVETIWLTAPAE